MVAVLRFNAKGEQGDRGPQGPQGDPGDPGDIGDTGPYALLARGKKSGIQAADRTLTANVWKPLKFENHNVYDGMMNNGDYGFRVPSSGLYLITMQTALISGHTCYIAATRNGTAQANLTRELKPRMASSHNFISGPLRLDSQNLINLIAKADGAATLVPEATFMTILKIGS